MNRTNNDITNGDAFRLLVSIGPCVTIHRVHPMHGNPHIEVQCRGGIRVVEHCQDNDASYEAATKIAVLRAADEIKKVIK